jgi:hypothetical protein
MFCDLSHNSGSPDDTAQQTKSTETTIKTQRQTNNECTKSNRQLMKSTIKISVTKHQVPMCSTATTAVTGTKHVGHEHITHDHSKRVTN